MNAFLSDEQTRIETDPADRTQLRMTVASGDPALTYEYVFKFPGHVPLTQVLYPRWIFLITNVQVEGVHQRTIS